MKYFALLGAVLLLLISPLIAAPSAGAADDFEISKADFFEEGLAPVRKPRSYDITIVYFMDYQCPACRKYTPDVARVLKEDPRVRVIYRDTPILGPRSDRAALAAIAASFQGRHEPFHLALMTTNGPLDESAIRAAAGKVGVDWPRLERDMISRREDIDLLIARNFELATEIGIAGTPAFIVGERQANGALDYKSLKLEIADARKELRDSGKAPATVIAGISAEATAKKQKSEPTQAADVAPKETNAQAVTFEKRTEGPRAASSANSGRNDTWKWLVSALMAGVGLAAIWWFTRARRTGRSNPTMG